MESNNSYYAVNKDQLCTGINMLVMEISDINVTSKNQCHKTHTRDERESINCIKHNLKTGGV